MISANIINQLREELEQTSTASWSDVQTWVDRATTLIRQHLPQRLSEFQSIAVEPPILQTDVPWPGGTKEEFVRFTEAALAVHDERNAVNNKAVKHQILGFLSQLQA